MATIDRLETTQGEYSQVIPASMTGDLTVTVTSGGGGGACYAYTYAIGGGGGGGCIKAVISAAAINARNGGDISCELGAAGVGGVEENDCGSDSQPSSVSGNFVGGGSPFYLFGQVTGGGHGANGGPGAGGYCSYEADPNITFSAFTGGEGGAGVGGISAGGGGSGACPTANGNAGTLSVGGASSGAGSGAGGSGSVAGVSPASAGGYYGGGGGSAGYPYYPAGDGGGPRLTITGNYTPVSISSNGGGATAEIDVADGETAVTTVTAENATGSVTFFNEGGDDAFLFDVASESGVVAFISPPDWNTPLDANADNVYDFTIRAEDGMADSDTQDLFITVLPPEDEGGHALPWEAAAPEASWPEATWPESTYPNDR